MKWTTTFVCPFIILMWMLTVFACTPRQQSAVMERADSLMDTRPDSALTLLNTLLPDTNTMSKRDLMRFHLLRTNAQNKCDTVFTARHAMLMHRVCDYNDHKSSKREANNKMLAHYLLGRCYDDMGEAPAALREFTIAEDQADTAKAGCDFILLSNIYYQNARLLLYQMVLPEAIESYRKAERSAYRGGDTLRAISCLEHTASAYYMMNEYDSVLSVCNRVMLDYRKHGDIQASYNPIPLMAQILTQRGKTKEAGEYFQEYETKSGLFGENGNIVKGREAYYAMKGDYLLAIGDYESAKKYFMKLIQIGGSLNRTEAAAKGLFTLYQKLQVPDSTSKYARLYCQANDSSYQHTYTEEMVRAKAMYDYNRLENTANAKSLEAAKNKNLVFILIGILSLLATISMVIYIWFWKVNKQKELDYTRMNIHYNSLLCQSQKMKESLERIQDEARDRLGELTNRILQLEREINEYQTQKRTNDEKYKTLIEKFRVSQKLLSDTQSRYQKEIGKYRKEIDILNLRLSEFQEDDSQCVANCKEEASLHYVIVSKFHQMASNCKVPKEEEWKELENVVSKNLSSFYSYITNSNKALSVIESRIAILVRLDFIVSECCILLDKKSQSVTNIRTRINRKLFDDKGTKSLKNNIMSL